jgi:hypothetical protein
VKQPHPDARILTVNRTRQVNCPMPSFPAIYAIRCNGAASPRLIAAFDGKTVVDDQDGTTITGIVVDQAELHGLIDRVANLGRELFDVRRVREGGPDAGSKD